MSERALVRRALRALNALPHCKAVKNHGSPYQEAGRPDVFACVRGQLHVLEFKTESGVVSPAQRAQLEAWARVGARCHVVRSVEAALAAVEDRS